MFGDAAKRLEYVGRQVHDEDGFRSFITTVGILLYATGNDAQANDLLRTAQARGQRGMSLQEVIAYAEPIGDTPFDKFVPWVFRAFNNLEYDSPQDYINAANALASVAPHLPSWQRKAKIDINQLSMAEVIAQIEAWLETTRPEPAQAGRIVYRFPDGWTVQRLVTEEQILSEGTTMRHCMRDPAKGYFQRTLCEGPFGSITPEIRIYSLRDANGVPHVTLMQDVASGAFVEVRSQGNKAVPPTLMSYVDKFLEVAQGAALGRRRHRAR